MADDVDLRRLHLTLDPFTGGVSEEGGGIGLVDVQPGQQHASAARVRGVEQAPEAPPVIEPGGGRC
jgi:hypothetical protein